MRKKNIKKGYFPQVRVILYTHLNQPTSIAYEASAVLARQKINVKWFPRVITFILCAQWDYQENLSPDGFFSDFQ